MEPARKAADPKISVIMVDGSFRERFHALESFARQRRPRGGVEVLWVEFYGGIRPELRSLAAGLPDVRTIALGHGSDEEYHSSACFNEGIRQSRGEVLYVVDGDVLADDDFLLASIVEHDAIPDLAMYFFRCDEKEQDHGPPASLEHLKRVGVVRSPFNFGACLSVRRRTLVRVNGYEQHPSLASGLHANGLDMYIRLRNLGVPIKWHPTLRLFHPWHAHSGQPAPAQQVELIRFKMKNLLCGTFRGLDPGEDMACPAKLQSARDTAAAQPPGQHPMLTFLLESLDDPSD